MNCDTARELIGADPDTASAELAAHLSACPECQAYQVRMQAFNAKLHKALELSPEGLRHLTSRQTATPPTDVRRPVVAPPVEPRSGARSDRRRTRPRGWALAASLVAALFVATGIWLTRPSDTLASEIVAHVEGEPGSWNQTELIAPAELEAVLRRSDVKLGPGLGPIVYAQSCVFRGHLVPHLVIATPSGPVTVMILKNEKVSAPQPFNESGYSGLLVPATTGSVAILSRGAGAQLEQPAREAVQALQSGGPAEK